jgi:hypothetical protein
MAIEAVNAIKKSGHYSPFKDLKPSNAFKAFYYICGDLSKISPP